MAVDMNETETKYDAPAGADLPRLDRLPQVAVTSGPEQQRLEADYYDTDDLRLIRAGITLRRRSGGHDDGWHLKLPLGGGTRPGNPRPLGGGPRRGGGGIGSPPRGGPPPPAPTDRLPHTSHQPPPG